MAVVIQPMVNVSAQEAAGVAFSIDPVGNDINQVLINAAFGLGETVVAGEAPVDEYRVNQHNEITSQTIATKPTALTRNGEETLPTAQQQQAAITAAQAADIATLARTAETHFGFPQDIEWAYENDTLYLLQSRPVTRFPARWTRDESAERFPNPVTPLTWQLCEAGFHRSLNYSFKLMGLPPFNDKWFTMKNNYIYGNQNAVERYAGRMPSAPLHDQHALEQFIENGGIWQYTWIADLPNRWMNDLDTYLIHIGRFNAIDYQNKTLAECWQTLQDINAVGTTYFLPNIAISLTQTLLYRLLKHLLTIGAGEAQAQTLFDHLTAITDTKTASVNQQLWQLSRQLQTYPTLQNHNYPDAASLNAALDEHPEFATAFRQFLDQHGHRETDFDAYHPTWIEAPHTVFAQIQILSTHPEQNHTQHYWEKKKRMLTTEHEVLKHTPPKLRFLLQELIRLVRTYTALDDIEHYQTTRLTIPFRQAAREIGKRLVNRGALDEAMDVFFLDPETLNNAITTDDYRAIRPTAEANKATYQQALARTPEWEYGKTTAPISEDSTHYQGLGGSPGSTEGEIYIITHPDQFAQFPQGAILVARTTNPAWTPLFYHAKAVITESGGPLSHGAVTARELGIPAVMSIRDACTRFKNGDRVQVDGSNGIIKKL